MWQLKIYNADDENIFEDVDDVDTLEDDVAEAMCKEFDRYTLLESAQQNEYDFDDIYEAQALLDFAYASESITGDLLAAIEDVVNNPSQYAYPAFTLAYYEE